jgi:hypothetical protein
VKPRFSYYDRLTAKEKVTYRKSDAVSTIALPGAESLLPLVAELESALQGGKRVRVAAATKGLVTGILAKLELPPIAIHVREVRPQITGGELHGLYTFAEGDKGPKLEVWMRTAAHAKVVRFRTFLRTLLHELVHHLDVTLLGLGDSFHTDGFFRRESSLVRQLLPSVPSRPKAERPTKTPESGQMTLF